MKPYTQISQNDALSRAKALADRRASDHNLKDMQRLRDALPIAEFKQTLLDAVENHQVVLVAGATGCGKTTQVPQFLFEGAAAFPNPKTVYLYCPDRQVHYLHHKYCPWSSALLTSQVDCYLP